MNLSVDERVTQAFRMSNLEFFMEAFIIASWEIWNLRMLSSLIMVQLLLAIGLGSLKLRVFFTS
jgi:hypothetical protein